MDCLRFFSVLSFSFFLGSTGFSSLTLKSQDLGFRFVDGVCQNSTGETGYNPYFLGPCGDFSGVSFKNMSLKDLDLRGSKFSGTSFENFQFIDVKLEAAEFIECQFTSVQFQRTSLTEVHFTNCAAKSLEFENLPPAQGVRFFSFQASGWIWSLAPWSCEDCLWEQTQLGSNFAIIAHSQLRNNIFRDSSLERASLNSIDFEGSQFERVNLKNAKIEKSNLKGVHFRDSNLRGASLRQSSYEGLRGPGSFVNSESQLPFSKEMAVAMGFRYIEVSCDPKTELQHDGRCYYLDGSGGSCLEKYELAPESVLESIAPLFRGLKYKTTNSANCCVAHKNYAQEGINYGMRSADCNSEGPYTIGPVRGGSACEGIKVLFPGMLTLCMSKED